MVHPKNTGYAGYPNNVGSKGWYVESAGICYNFDDNRAILYLSEYRPAELKRATEVEELPSEGFEEISEGDSLFTEGDEEKWDLYGDIKSGDRLTIICQECDFGSYTGSGQFQAILKVVGYESTNFGLLVELDTSLPYCATIFNNANKTAGDITLERLLYAWLNNQPNEAYGDSEDAIVTRTLIPDENTVRVYGKPELGVVDIITSAVVEGIGNEASGQGSVAFGRANKVSGTGSAAFGRNHVVPGYTSYVFGHGNKAYGEKNFMSGFMNTAYGLYSTAFGKENKVGVQDSATEEGGFASGYQNTVTGFYSAAIGVVNQVSNERAVALGYKNTISSDRSFASGSENNISSTGNIHVALGYNNNISGDCSQSVVIGANNVASHTKVFEFGQSLKSSDRDQTILGRFNADLPIDTEFAIGVGESDTKRKTLVRANTTKLFVNESPVVTEAGCNTLIIGSTSGQTANTNTGNYKLTVGNGNTNSVENGIVGGKNNVNSGAPASTFLFGESLHANPLRSSTVVGTHNDYSESYLFSVGCGSSEATRKNCFAVKGSKLFADVTEANINVSGNWNIGKLHCNKSPDSHNTTLRIKSNSGDNLAGSISFFDSGASSDTGYCAVSMANIDNNAAIGVASNWGSDGNQHIKVMARDGIRIFSEYANYDTAFDYVQINYAEDSLAVNKPFQVPIFNEDGTRTEDYATIKVVRNSSGQLQLMIS